jgi:shikimate dehydrogenase
MFPKNEGKIIDISAFPKLTGVIDVVYNPLRTNLVLDAMERGLKTEAGLYMLVSQAVYASEFFMDTTYDDSVCEKVFKDIFKEKENIVLIGMPSSGKTTVGKCLAEITGKEFIDTDDEIVKRIGMDIPSYFREYGEDEFRRVESEIVAEVSKKNGMIISTGGGAVLKYENVRNLRQNGRLYFLNRSLELLTPTKSRPLSSDIEALKRRFDERYEIYLKTADRRIDASGDPTSVADLIEKEL